MRRWATPVQHGLVGDVVSGVSTVTADFADQHVARSEYGPGVRKRFSDHARDITVPPLSRSWADCSQYRIRRIGVIRDRGFDEHVFTPFAFAAVKA